MSPYFLAIVSCRSRIWTLGTSRALRVFTLVILNTAEALSKTIPPLRGPPSVRDSWLRWVLRCGATAFCLKKECSLPIETIFFLFGTPSYRAGWGVPGDSRLTPTPLFAAKGWSADTVECIYTANFIPGFDSDSIIVKMKGGDSVSDPDIFRYLRIRSLSSSQPAHQVTQ